MKEKQLEWKGVNSASMWHHQNDIPYATPKEDWRRKEQPFSQRSKMHRRQMGAQADFSLGVIRFGRDCEFFLFNARKGRPRCDTATYTHIRSTSKNKRCTNNKQHAEEKACI
ncbi:hypothetical protein J3458_021874 [Metarhizium acridum]|uniref:uncharacterized protein n=1 Tax=Metarhizium acridum TaxID=92637 RepID=UPI001C6B3035|nr:hypothetical protein J3458_021874 [Metarhizium acridum]